MIETKVLKTKSTTLSPSFCTSTVVERRRHGGGIKGLDDKSSGMEILMAEDFVKIKLTDPLILARQAKETTVCRSLKPMFHGEHAGIKASGSHHKCGLKCQV
jgi:hypothetical protein